jgi:hypothetical protein
VVKLRQNDRFPLLLYKRLIGRQRIPSLLLSIVFLGLWYGVNTDTLDWPTPIIADLMLPAGLLCLVFFVFTLIGPRGAFAQPKEDHLLLQTPIFRIRIRYEQIKNTRPVKMGKVFIPTALPAGRRHFLSRYLGHTGLSIDLVERPRFLFLLRLFFHYFTFSPDTPGFIILVQDWIRFSQLLSSKLDSWRTEHNIPARGMASDAAPIIEQSRAEEKKWWEFWK